MSQIYKKILIVKRFGVKKIGENAIVKLNEAIKDLTPNSNRPHPRPLSRREGRDHRGYPYFAACVLMGLCILVRSVLLCNSVRERTQEARWKLYLSQIFTDEQRPFC